MSDRPPIGIPEWAVLTKEMMEKVYPERAFPADGKYGWMQSIRDALETVQLFWPDSVEKGREILDREETR